MTRLEGAPICPSFRRARVSARLRNPPAAPTCEATMKLEGVKVVDLSVFLPGPYLTMAMADHGAEVIKVEPPGEGDPGRHIGLSDGQATVFFRNVNRGNRSAVLDLKSEAGRAAPYRLCDQAYVFLTHYRPGLTQLPALDWVTSSAAHPQQAH